MINVQTVSKTIKKKEVLQDITFDFEEGKGYLVRGHNGSGKTMLLRLLCGLIRPSKGDVLKNKPYTFGVMIENPDFLEGQTALYNLKYLAAINKRITEEEILKALKKVDLYNQRHEPVKKYSLGMKQRLGLCQAIMEKPDVLLLDEPFNALDDDSYKQALTLLSALKDDGKMLIVAAHDQELITNPLFDEVIVLENGHVKERKSRKNGDVLADSPSNVTKD
ncbi:ABC transporter ATP-binding protein [Salipaludibacillus sp. LMS25]|jgi:ABC-2 type transport system ATP-binding protein|uniref:ABC transporter ATP-binding protein n=1 Tax=Salipaludibacillus sp. LMS25 TaxID=2924031 RepID=UPI0020D019C0|nr:ABC transporter ATP-binding protein [Salipaludibacillus sp. LMS25]UTR16479.1 ABC transporter ATP-binding protein [Salipaludibacillus sp. LMS25]